MLLNLQSYKQCGKNTKGYNFQVALLFIILGAP